MNKKQLKEAREDLVSRLRKDFRATRVTSLMDTGCMIEGGKFPATYHVGTGLSIWGRGSRYSGSSMTVTQLVELELIVDKFFYDYMGVAEVVQKEV